MIALLLDEACSKVLEGMGNNAMTKSLIVKYAYPVPTRAMLLVVAEFKAREERRLIIRAKILDAQSDSLACANATFVEVDSALFRTLR